MSTETKTVKALTFDTGGTILDWHSGISGAFSIAGAQRGLKADWGAVANEYRRRSLKAMVNAEHPPHNFDDVMRLTLDEVIAHFKLDALEDTDRNMIWRTWHALEAWPDFPASAERMRKRYVVASFTILTTSLIIDVSRKNHLNWDAIFSCEMIGIYKTRPEPYLAVAKWLQLKPAEIMMVACHNFDLDAARACGYQTAFVRRPDEWGAAGPPDPTPNPACTLAVDNFGQLAEKLGA
jgi:2-haloacid dehalogenase